MGRYKAFSEHAFRKEERRCAWWPGNKNECADIRLPRESGVINEPNKQTTKNPTGSRR